MKHAKAQDLLTSKHILINTEKKTNEFHDMQPVPVCRSQCYGSNKVYFIFSKLPRFCFAFYKILSVLVLTSFCPTNFSAFVCDQGCCLAQQQEERHRDIRGEGRWSNESVSLTRTRQDHLCRSASVGKGCWARWWSWGPSAARVSGYRRQRMACSSCTWKASQQRDLRGVVHR